MRTIKFRAKSIKTGEWVYGYLAPLPDGAMPIGSVPCVNVNPETVSQYTGRKDRNGTPIYEGDIIDFYDDECGKPNNLCGSRLEVAYSDEEARFVYTNRVEGHEYTSGFDKMWRENLYVVIGNRWDTPKLLKSEEGGGE